MNSPIPPTIPTTQYFAFLADNNIRIKGTRIGIEHMLYEDKNPDPAIQRLKELKNARNSAA